MDRTPFGDAGKVRVPQGAERVYSAGCCNEQHQREEAEYYASRHDVDAIGVVGERWGGGDDVVAGARGAGGNVRVPGGGVKSLELGGGP